MRFWICVGMEGELTVRFWKEKGMRGVCWFKESRHRPYGLDFGNGWVVLLGADTIQRQRFHRFLLYNLTLSTQDVRDGRMVPHRMGFFEIVEWSWEDQYRRKGTENIYQESKRSTKRLPPVNKFLTPPIFPSYRNLFPFRSASNSTTTPNTIIPLSQK